jgi:hypothetical protein
MFISLYFRDFNDEGLAQKWVILLSIAISFAVTDCIVQLKDIKYSM